jgi:hypothetical protein
MALQMIASRQVQRLHVLKQKLQMTDEDYRAALGGYGVATCKHLSFCQADELINKFEADAVQRGQWVRRERPAADKQRFDELGNRPGYAAPKQLRMLEAMWMGVSRQETREEKERAMNRFISRITGVDNIRWLDPVDARKVIKAIAAMKHGGDHGTPTAARTAQA